MLFKNKTFLIICTLSTVYLALFAFLALTSQSIYNAGFWCGFTFTVISILLVFSILIMSFVINKQDKAKVIIIPIILTSIIYLLIQLIIGIVAVIQNSGNITILIIIQIVLLVVYCSIIYGLHNYQGRYMQSSINSNYKKIILTSTEKILIENNDDSIAEMFEDIKRAARYIDVEVSEETRKYYQEIAGLLQSVMEKQNAINKEDILKAGDRVLKLLRYIKI